MDLKNGKSVLICGEEKSCYIRHHTRTKGKRFTLAFVKIGKNTFDVGIAILNKKDTYYKRRGREIAIGRAQIYPCAVLALSEDNKSLRAAFNFVEEQLSEKLDKPSTIINNILNEGTVITF